MTKDNSAKLGDLGNCQRLPEEKKEPATLNAENNMLEQIGEVEGLFEKEKDEDEEENQEKVGTPFYLAPELWLNKPNTKASDIWALGVILYELCVQRFPWQATEMDELEQKVLNEKFTPLPNYVKPEF